MTQVFVSYVHEDYLEVCRLVDALKVYDITVWLDREQLQGGRRWKDGIRTAIAQGDYFLACFSRSYHERSKSYMNEELTIAIDELRQRPTDRSWFIPVLLSECQVPDRNIGGGDSLHSLQWISVHEDWAEGMRRILAVVAPRSSIIFEHTLGLSDTSARARIKAADDLGKLEGLAKEAVPSLIERLGDNNETVRAAAAHALGKIRDPASIPALITSLGRDDYPNQHASSALVGFGSAAVPGLIDRLQNLERKIEAGDRDWLPIAVANTLGGIGSNAVSAVPALLEAIQKGTCDLWSSYIALGNIGDVSAVPVLIDAVGGYRSVNAIGALGQIGDAAAVPILIEVLDQGEYDSSYAASALGMIGDRRATSALIRNILLDENKRYAQETLYSSIGALGRIGDASALPVLIQTLKHEGSGVRSEAARALKDIGDPRSVPALIDQLNAKRGAESNSATAEALGKIRDPSAIPALKEALNDDSQWCRLSAARALVDFGDPAAEAALIRLLKEGEQTVSREAERLLRRLGTPEAISALSGSALGIDE